MSTEIRLFPPYTVSDRSRWWLKRTITIRQAEAEMLSSYYTLSLAHDHLMTGTVC